MKFFNIIPESRLDIILQIPQDDKETYDGILKLFK